MGEADYGLHVWPCAEALAGFILANKQLFCDKTVLELGSGTAVAGMTAAKCGSKVVLSDKNDERLKYLATVNCQNNGINDFTFTPISWGRIDEKLLSLPNIDLIISSDCFYDPTVFEDVLVTVGFLLRRNPRTTFYFSYQERSADWSIELLLQKWNLKCSKLPYLCQDSIHIGLIVANKE